MPTQWRQIESPSTFVLDLGIGLESAEQLTGVIHDLIYHPQPSIDPDRIAAVARGLGAHLRELSDFADALRPHERAIAALLTSTEPQE